MKNMTDEQARRYIAGEEFDESEWERLHILRLAKSIENGKVELNPIYYNNLRKTGEKYIENHKDTSHIDELNILKCAVESII